MQIEELKLQDIILSYVKSKNKKRGKLEINFDVDSLSVNTIFITQSRKGNSIVTVAERMF